MTVNPKIRKPFVGEYPISFYFGENPSWYVKQMGYPHNGIDFAMPVGIPIVACDAGRIAYADNVPDTNGLGVNIIHSLGIVAILALIKTYRYFRAGSKQGRYIGL